MMHNRCTQILKPEWPNNTIPNACVREARGNKGRFISKLVVFEWSQCIAIIAIIPQMISILFKLHYLPIKHHQFWSHGINQLSFSILYTMSLHNVTNWVEGRGKCNLFKANFKLTGTFMIKNKPISIEVTTKCILTHTTVSFGPLIWLIELRSKSAAEVLVTSSANMAKNTFQEY